jgi:signal transduction histidine kinase
VTETGPFTELNTRRLGPVRRFFVRHPRAMDAVVVTLAAISAATSDLSSGRSGSVAPHLLFAAAAAIALVWRRLRPLAVTVGIVTLGVLSVALTHSLGGLDLAFAFALYAVVTSGHARTSWLTAAVASGVIVGSVWWWGQPGPGGSVRTSGGSDFPVDDRLDTTVQVVILTLAAMAIGNSVRARREHLADLMERANAVGRDRDRQVQLARAAERSRIAREMHDVVAHSLSVMITLADGAAVALDRSPDRSRAALTELSSTGRAALRDMRQVLGALAEDDAPLEPTGQSQDLAGLVDRFRTAGLPLHAVGVSLAPPTDTGLRLALYRVVQESLTNVLRHAPGTARVDLELSRRPDRWEVTVVDQGGVVPAPESDGAGLGLVGMRERVELFGGTVEAGPGERGWRVHVSIPAREEQR